MLVKEFLVLWYKSVCDEHQAQMCRGVLRSIVEVIVEVPLKVILIEPAALDFNQ
jgi:hypothetical protein